MNNFENRYLMHHGVLGMKWGVRKSGTVSNKNSGKKTSKYKNQIRKQKLKRVAKILGTSALLSLTVNSLLKSGGVYTVSSGKQTVNSFMKSNGKKKISECEKSWADYAWEEIQKS